MRSSKSGFTIVELLVVIAIIGLLIAILLPAIGATRESARLTHCRNNLKQIGAATNSYISSFDQFPGNSGEALPLGVRFEGVPGSGRPGRGRPGTSNRDLINDGGTWMVQILPYMEDTALQKLLVRVAEQEGRQREETLRGAVTQPVNAYYCVSRRAAIAYPLHRAYKSQFGERGARTDYAMNGGASSAPGRRASIDEPGLWVPNRRVKPNELRGGFSKTYLAGEKAMEQDLYELGTDRGDLSPIAGWHDHPGAANSYVRYAIRSPAKDSKENCLACHDFGSAHTAGWNVVLADGSVHTRSFTMDVNVHRAFASVQAEKSDLTE